jgi:uncharacterized protein with FMN-binding domain
MKRRYLHVLALLCVMGYGGYIFFYAPILKAQKAVRDIQFEDINLSLASDGEYGGEFGEGSHTYAVMVIISGQRIIDIEVVKNRDGEHARRAEGVIDLVLEAQSVNVDVITGATTTSKSILKAIEDALQKAVNPESEAAITGLIFAVENGRILVVEGIESVEIAYDEWFQDGKHAIWLDITEKTLVTDINGRSVESSVLEKGNTVAVWTEGGIQKSYPAQGIAAKIVIRKQ